jgi:hypothetical protein
MAVEVLAAEVQPPGLQATAERVEITAVEVEAVRLRSTVKQVVTAATAGLGYVL